MEAVRQRQVVPTEDDSENPLPPPPTPFPADILNAVLTSSAVDQTGVSRSLIAVQKSCIYALSTLLPQSAEPPRTGTSSYADDLQDGVNVDSKLAEALMELLKVTYEIEKFVPPLTVSDSEDQVVECSQDAASSMSPEALEDLERQLEDLKSARSTNGPRPSLSVEGLHPAIEIVRCELAWARMESLSSAVFELSKERVAREQRECLPPSYGSHNIDAGLPRYQEHDSLQESDEATSTKLYKPDETESQPQSPFDSPQPQHQPTAQREKMLHELEAVTSAIEHLHTVAPQLQNQRVGLRPRVGSHLRSESTPVSTEREVNSLSAGEKKKIEKIKAKELEQIYKMMDKSRGMDGQRAHKEDMEIRLRDKFMTHVVEQSSASRLAGQDSEMGFVDAELARARELQARDHFLRDLINQSAERRLGNQDAEALSEDLIASRLAKQQELITTIISHNKATRLSSQDFPITVEDRMAEKALTLIGQLVDYSSSGRLHDQDSLPPTPKTMQEDGGEETNPFEIISVADFLNSSRPSSRAGEKEKGKESQTLARERSNSEGGKRNVVSKIAGMVRRGSVHLGLKAPSSLDVKGVGYVVEHQEQLKNVQIMLYGASVSSNSELVVETSPSTTGSTNKAVIISKRDASLSIPLNLPVPVYPQQSAPILQQSSHLETKLSALPTPPQAAQLSITHALSAPELRELKPKSLICSSCERSMSTLPAPHEDLLQAYKDLPSTHWAEMIDVWMCHDDPKFTGRLASLMKEGFWPRDGGVLIGGSWFLVESQRGAGGNLKKQSKSEDDPWHLISCACGALVGKERNDDGQPGAGTLRFSKWAVGLLREDEDDNFEVTRYPLSVFVVSDMLELAQAHASHRFVVSEEETGDPKLYLWLFNSSTSISYCKPSLSASPLPSPLRASFAAPQTSERRNSKSRRSSVASSITTSKSGTVSGNDKEGAKGKAVKAVKVMFKAADDLIDPDSLPGFGPGGQVEHLSYSRDVCTRLIATLRDSNGVYPPMRRGMGAFDVGFLERV